LPACFFYTVNAQSQTPDDGRFLFTKGKYNLELGAGLATYQGDLTEKNTFFGQPGYAASLGTSYNLSNQL
jgi:hypothetical protein